MARQTKVTLIDDLDGESEAVQTVAFSLDSVSYEIDLGDEHAQELRTVLRHYAAAGRRMGGPRAVRTRVKGPSEAGTRVRRRPGPVALRRRRRTFGNGPGPRASRSAVGAGSVAPSVRRTTPRTDPDQSNSGGLPVGSGRHRSGFCRPAAGWTLPAPPPGSGPCRPAAAPGPRTATDEVAWTRT